MEKFDGPDCEMCGGSGFLFTEINPEDPSVKIHLCEECHREMFGPQELE